MGQRLMSLKLGTFLDFIVCSSDGVGDDWCFYGGVFNRLFRSTVSLQLVSMGGFKATALEFASSSAKNDAFHQFQKLNHDLGCIIN